MVPKLSVPKSTFALTSLSKSFPNVASSKLTVFCLFVVVFFKVHHPPVTFLCPSLLLHEDASLYWYAV